LGYVDWIDQAQVMDEQRALANTVMNPQAGNKCGESLEKLSDWPLLKKVSASCSWIL
jgi:hypothetical protein